MSNYYQWILVVHIISVITWMAGLFYLPRLYAYHSRPSTSKEMSETFKIMEKKLYSVIMFPSSLLVWLSGLSLFHIQGMHNWLLIKIILVILMTGFHIFLWYCLGKFQKDKNRLSEKFYRIVNEFPSLLLIGIVILVVVKPL